MEYNEKNHSEEKEQTTTELESEQMEQAAGGGINLGALLEFAKDGTTQLIKTAVCMHEPGEILSEKFINAGTAYTSTHSYLRIQKIRCSKCGTTYEQKSIVPYPEV